MNLIYEMSDFILITSFFFNMALILCCAVVLVLAPVSLISRAPSSFVTVMMFLFMFVSSGGLTVMNINLFHTFSK